MPIQQTFFRYAGADGAPLAGFRWSGGKRPRALLQLAHGAGEHAGRYRERLAPLVEAGFLIYAADHRGHGLTSGLTTLGDFGPGGAEACLSDMAALARLAKAENPGLPLVLMGHSMGAMFSQAWLPEHSDLIDALVLSGTTGDGAPLNTDFNSAFENPRTPYDWLSRDPAEVDAYLADPFCGIAFNEVSQASFYGLAPTALSGGDLSKVRKGLPVYIFLGDADPVNSGLVGVRPLVAGYEAAGLDVTFKVYPAGRHEMLNETNRQEVIADLLAWLEAKVPA